MRDAIASYTKPLDEVKQPIAAMGVLLVQGLWMTIDSHDRRSSVVLHIHLKIKLSGIEEDNKPFSTIGWWRAS